MQRSTAVNAQDLCGFLELLLIGLVIFHIFVVVVCILVAAVGRSVSLPLLASSSSTFLGFLLVAPLVFSLLLLNKLLDLLAALEVMALGAVDLAVLLVCAVLLVGDRHSLVVGACGNALVGATSFGFLARLLND